MKFEVTTWLDTSDHEAEEFPQKWGVKVTGHNGDGLLSEGGRLVEFDTPAEAAAKVEALREQHGGAT